MSSQLYKKHFDPVDYFTDWYLQNQLDCQVSIPLLYKLYNSDKFKGGSLLELCSGPVVHWTAAASRKYTDITITDLLDTNLAQVRKWLLKAPDAFKWTEVFKLSALAEGVSDPKIIEERIRTAVKEVVVYDVLQKEKPFLDKAKQFDLVQCSYGLECATLDRATLELAFKNISSLVKPGGAFVYLTTMQSTYFILSNQNFPLNAITKELLEDILTGAGFENIEFSEVFGQKKVDESLCDYKGSFLCSAFKKH